MTKVELITHIYGRLKKTPNICIYIDECFSQKNDLNIEKIKVKFSQIFRTLITILKEETKIVLTKTHLY